MGADVTVSEHVVDAVAATIGTGPLSLPPLYDAVDSDALNQLFASWTRTPEQTTGVVIFEYAGTSVRLTVADGDVTVDVTPFE